MLTNYHAYGNKNFLSRPIFILVTILLPYFDYHGDLVDLVTYYHKMVKKVNSVKKLDYHFSFFSQKKGSFCNLERVYR